jgi:serine/threonine protein kinase
LQQQGSLATTSGEERRVILKRVKDRVQGAQEMAEMEHLLNVYASSACRKSVAPFLGYIEVDPTEVRGKLTKGLWLVWEAQGLNTLAYYLKRRDCIAALAKDLEVPEDAVIPTVMQQIFECLIDLHNAGLVHRDIKPANIVFSDAERRFKLIDLGAAADLRTGTNYSPDKTILDPMYCPPEEYVLPSDAPNLSEKAGIISVAMSPLLWKQHRPDCFDTWSAGIVLMQLGLPFLRSTTGLRNWRNTFARCDYDIEEWRMRAALSAKQTALLDANEGLGWDLVTNLLRPREVESDGKRGVRFINTGSAPRLTPAAALKHPFFKTAAAGAAGTSSKVSFSSKLGSLFSFSSSQDEEDENTSAAGSNTRSSSSAPSGSRGTSGSRGSTSREKGSKGSSSKSRGAVILDSSTVAGGVGVSTRGRPASTWNWMKSKLFDLEARLAQEASETQTQTTVVNRLKQDVAAGKASAADLEKEESALLSMRSSLQTSAKELNTLYSSAKGFLSAVVKPGGSGEVKLQQAEEEDANEAAAATAPAAIVASVSSQDGDDTFNSSAVSKSMADAATNAIYSSLKFTGMALNAVSDLAAAAERGVSKAQAEAAQRRAANAAFIDALQALKPPLSATSTWEDVSKTLQEGETSYAVLTETQRMQAFEVYVDALQRAERNAAQRAAVAFTALVEETVSSTMSSGDSYADFATSAAARDPRFSGVSSDADRRAAFDAFVAKRKAEEQRILAEIAAEAERAAARAAAAKEAEAATAKAIAAAVDESSSAALGDVDKKQPSASAVTAPDVQQLEFLKAEQARLKDEYARMEAKLQEMEQALSLQNLVGSLLDDGSGSVVEADEDGNVIFRFAAATPPAGKQQQQQEQVEKNKEKSSGGSSGGGVAESIVENAASRDYY